MGNRIFISTVCLLWLSSMTWLVIDKVLPSFFNGKPPIASGLEEGKVVAWRVQWAGRPVGWAASLRVPGALGTTELHNRVILQNVPLLDLAPAWMRNVIGDIGKMKFDTKTRIEFDALDNFASFRCRVAINDVPSVLRMSGEMKKTHLEFKVRSGDLTYTTQIYIPHQSALGEALFPDARLPYMYVGRRWQKEVYSPFRSPSSPVELVDAEVVAIESLEHDGGIQRVMRIDYLRMPGPGVPEASRRVAVCWVEPKSGIVLRQDVYVANSILRFERQSDEIAYRKGLELLPQLDFLEPETDSVNSFVVRREEQDAS